ncbi:hypothetical protein [Cryobacterium sp. HLT2-28]|uniref:hypothetical protein n=1 Tax=Cryobacterium sp. HLT2-28 TaxID=1259146 RepID=UPI00106A6250|nr:hypothetical protein [Cryobacterium sp. HLT2-28]TFB96088.1 hypothetical protein E3O48_05180 [Cryobacterium sp. HLT2-28]
MDVQLQDGLPVTTPLQTWFDLGPLLYRGDLVAAADFLCAGREPRHTPSELRAAAARLVGRRGCRRLREAAFFARARVDSAKETEVRLLLVDAGLPEPVVNLELTDAFGRFVARVDLAWPGRTGGSVSSTRATATARTAHNSAPISPAGNASKIWAGE